MTVTLHALGGRTCRLRAVTSPRAVFIAEQPRIGSAAGTPHTGLATLHAWLKPVNARGLFACVKLPSGRDLIIRASAIAPAANVAAIRLSPLTRPASRMAPVTSEGRTA
jgi:hypothetical protein